MKIAFVNPPDRNTVIEFPDDKGDSFLEADDYGYFPPLGLLYVLSYLEKTGWRPGGSALAAPGPHVVAVAEFPW